MNEHDKIAIQLLAMGALIAIAKLLNEDQKITVRVILARCVLNAFTTLSAGIILLVTTDPSPLLLLGVGAVFGTLGSEVLQAIYKSFMKKQLGVGDE